jgi:hypothetical protein
MGDHLSCETTFAWPQGWSPIAGFTVFPQRAKLDLRKHSFTVRTSQIWNSLPDHVVNAKTLNTFKNRLDTWPGMNKKSNMTITNPK